MAIKHYTVKQSWLDLEVTLQVDHDVLTVERATSINSFWSNPEDRIEDEDGDEVRSVIKQVNEEEGYGGSEYCGVTLLECEGEIEILLEDLDIAEVKVSEPLAEEEA